MARRYPLAIAANDAVECAAVWPAKPAGSRVAVNSVSGGGGDRGPHGGEQRPRPLGDYALLMATYAGCVVSFATWLARSGRTVAETVRPGDLVLVSIATHKAARLVSRDRVTSVLRAPFTSPQRDAGVGEVDDTPRGSGLRLAVGQAILCPHCVGLWIATAFTAGLLVVPRLARWTSFALTAAGVADFLQIAYRRAAEL
jgi:hypothetical protein